MNAGSIGTESRIADRYIKGQTEYGTHGMCGEPGKLRRLSGCR